MIHGNVTKPAAKMANADHQTSNVKTRRATRRVLRVLEDFFCHDLRGGFGGWTWPPNQSRVHAI